LLSFIKKICGFTSLKDAKAATQFGASHLGFVFAPNSPRKVSLETVKKIRNELRGKSKGIKFVAVVAGNSPDEISKIDQSNLFDIIQIHDFFDDSTIFDKDSGQFSIQTSEIWPVLRVKDKFSLKPLNQIEDRYPLVLLDTFSKHAVGGTGSTFDWSILKDFFSSIKTRFILAGGINEKKLLFLLKQDTDFMGKRIAGFDCSSGVETIPGKKDPEKMKNVLHLMDACEQRWEGNHG
jgi:phosphoribosylanthranilate isomerase